MNKQKAKNIPKLRFSGFGDAWKEKNYLTIFTNKVNGASLKPRDFLNSPGHKVVPKKSISKSGILSMENNNLTYCNDKAFTKFSDSLVDNNYLITTLRDLVPSGPNLGYLVHYYNNEKYILAQGVYGFLTDKKKASKLFLVQLAGAPTYRKKMYRIKVGSTQVHIRSSEFLKLVHLLPTTLEEQQKIADFLGSVDEWIGNLEKQKEALETYKRGMMQKIFPPEAAKPPKLRFKDDNGKDFPEWEECTLNEFTQINPPPTKLESKFIYIDLESVKEGRLLNPKMITRGNAPSRAQRTLQNRDILFQTVRPYQMNNYLFSLNGNYVASTGYAQLRTNHNPYFLYYLVHSFALVKTVLRFSTGTNYPAINSNDLKKIKVHYPCAKEQQKIAEFLSLIDMLIQSKQSQITKAKKWKKGLLQQMFV